MYHVSIHAYAGEGRSNLVEMSHRLAIAVLSLVVKPISGGSTTSTGTSKLSIHNQRTTSVLLKDVCVPSSPRSRLATLTGIVPDNFTGAGAVDGMETH